MLTKPLNSATLCGYEVLQRGRAPAGAECKASARTVGFNGAAPARARSETTGRATVREFGRNSFTGAAPARARSGAPHRHPALASTGPRPRGRGVALIGIASSRSPSFNGAAPARARSAWIGCDRRSPVGFNGAAPARAREENRSGECRSCFNGAAPARARSVEPWQLLQRGRAPAGAGWARFRRHWLQRGRARAGAECARIAKIAE